MKKFIGAVAVFLSLSCHANDTKYLRCNAVMTDEQTGSTFKKPFEINPAAFTDGVFYQEKGKVSTTIYYNASKNQGDISILVGPEIVVSGYFSCEK